MSELKEPNKAVEFREFLINNFYVSDGKLFRKVNISKSMLKNTEAGTTNKIGYRQVKINKVLYYTHRLIFLMEFGFMPTTVDHINGDKLDNRIENLRQATYRENNCNVPVRKNNTSGVKGVYFSKRFNTWHARVFRNGIAVASRYFRNFDDAVSFRNEAAKIEYGEFICQ